MLPFIAMEVGLQSSIPLTHKEAPSTMRVGSSVPAAQIPMQGERPLQPSEHFQALYINKAYTPSIQKRSRMVFRGGVPSNQPSRAIV
jgi:hypothetical protein